MRRARPQTLLFVLISVVPMIVAAAGVAAVLLQRAGFGILIWGLVPFLVSLLLIGVVGALLGRAAAGSRPDGGDGRPGKDDGV